MSAIFSPDGKYRYRLDRCPLPPDTPGPPHRVVLFAGLNPSIAGRQVDGVEITDPTATRMRGFTQSWGYDCFTICNLFGLVATDPRELIGLSKLGDAGLREAVGPDNDEHVRKAAGEAALIVACWGSSYPGVWAGRARYMRLLLEQYGPVHHCGLTKGGDPKHPLYLPGNTFPAIWNVPE